MRAHRLREQAVLVAEMAVDGELGDPGLGRDLVHADPLETVADEHPLGRVQDRRALARVLRAAGAGRLGGSGGGRRRDLLIHA